jgi:hypothetical protein
MAQLFLNTPANVFSDNIADTRICPTSARVILPDLKIEPVIDGELLSDSNRSIAKKPNSIFTKMRSAIGFAGMIDKASDAALFRAIDIPLVIEFELVDIGGFSLALFFDPQGLSAIGLGMGDSLSCIFNDLSSRRDYEASINSSAMNFGVSNLQTRMARIGYANVFDKSHVKRGINGDFKNESKQRLEELRMSEECGLLASITGCGGCKNYTSSFIPNSCLCGSFV